MSTKLSTAAEWNIRELFKSSSWTKHQLWYAVLVTAVLIAIVASIAAQPQPEAIDYRAGNALPV
jgi:hypothetical protein